MDAKSFLLQVKKIDKIIENKMAEVEYWKSIADNTAPSLTNDIGKVQLSHNPQRIADAISKYIDLDNEINQEIDRLVDAKKKVIAVIERLSASEYDILHKIYIQYKPLYEIAILRKQSYSSVTTTHSRAIKKVQEILDAEVLHTSAIKH